MPTMPDAIEASPGTNVCEEVFNREALEHKITQAEEEIKGIEAKAHLLLHCAKINECSMFDLCKGYNTRRVQKFPDGEEAYYCGYRKLWIYQKMGGREPRLIVSSPPDKS